MGYGKINIIMNKVSKEQKRAGKVKIMYPTLQLVPKESDEYNKIVKMSKDLTDGTS